MTTSFFELVQTREFGEGEISQLPAHTDMYRLSLDIGERPGAAKLSIQLSSTFVQKSRHVTFPLAEQDLPRLMGAMVEMLFNMTGVEPPIQHSNYSRMINQLELFTQSDTG